MSIKYDKENKLWSNSMRIPMNELETSLGQWIWDSMLLHGPKIAQVSLIKKNYRFFAKNLNVTTSAQINDDNGVQLTFDEVRLRATRAAQNLQKRGLQRRQFFGIIASNTDDLLPIFLASIGLGCPNVPLRPLLTKDEMARILKKTKPDIIFCDIDTHAKLREALFESHLNPKLFLCGRGHVDGIESVENLFIETGDECSFV